MTPLNRQQLVRGARGLNLTTRRRTQNQDQSLFQRVKQAEARKKLEELEILEEKLRKRARFLAYLPKLRKEIIEEGLIPEIAFKRGHSLIVKGGIRKNRVNRLYSSMRNPKETQNTREPDFAQGAQANPDAQANPKNVHEVSVQVVNDYGQPNATSTLKPKQGNSGPSTQKPPSQKSGRNPGREPGPETGAIRKKPKDPPSQKSGREPGPETGAIRKKPKDPANEIIVLEVTEEGNGNKAKKQKLEKTQAKKRKATQKVEMVAAEVVPEPPVAPEPSVASPPAQPQNPENQRSKHPPRTVSGTFILPVTSNSTKTSQMETVRNDDDLRANHLSPLRRSVKERKSKTKLGFPTSAMSRIRGVIRRSTGKSSTKEQPALASSVKESSGQVPKSEVQNAPPPPPPPPPVEAANPDAQANPGAQANTGAQANSGAHANPGAQANPGAHANPGAQAIPVAQVNPGGGPRKDNNSSSGKRPFDPNALAEGRKNLKSVSKLKPGPSSGATASPASQYDQMGRCQSS